MDNHRPPRVVAASGARKGEGFSCFVARIRLRICRCASKCPTFHDLTEWRGWKNSTNFLALDSLQLSVTPAACLAIFAGLND
jgi:hypothetical protein